MSGKKWRKRKWGGGREGRSFSYTHLPFLYPHYQQQVDRQKLMRVYGALMWSMGKVRPREEGREGERA